MLVWKIEADSNSIYIVHFASLSVRRYEIYACTAEPIGDLTKFFKGILQIPKADFKRKLEKMPMIFIFRNAEHQF